MLTVSVAMATYNGERFIDEQLDSLARQTVLPAELVVTDDRSTDSTVARVLRFAEWAPFPVRLSVNSFQLGYKANFIECSNLCSGDLVAFCDQDDIWDDDKLDIIAKHFDETSALMIYHDLRVVDAENRRLPTPAYCREELTIGPWTEHRGLTQVFRRDLVRFNDIWQHIARETAPSSILAHDEWFPFLAYSFGGLVHLERSLLSYRQHHDNLFGMKERNRISNLSILLHKAKGLHQPLRNKRSDICHLISRRISGANVRTSGLKAILSREPNLSSQTLNQHIKFYEEAAIAYALRLEIYYSLGLGTRLLKFAEASTKGAYRPSTRGVKDLFLDFVYGVVGTPNWGRKQPLRT